MRYYKMTRKMFAIAASVSCLMFATASCDFKKLDDEMKDLKGKKFTVTDEELETILTALQKKLLSGDLPLSSLEKLMGVLGVSNKIEYPLVTLKLTDANRASLNTKFDSYTSLAPESLDANKFPKHCDGLLFAGLMRATGFSVDLTKAESAPGSGKWYRLPGDPCFSTGESKSTISRDMMMGLAHGLWGMGPSAKEIVERTLAYAKAHDWIIGEASDAETLYGRAFLTPSLATTFYELQYQFGGSSLEARKMPKVWDAKQDGFEAHLTMIHILLVGLMRGGITKTDMAIVALHASRQPHNALYNAILHAFSDGAMDGAANMLLTYSQFPSGALPSTSSRCTAYLFQHDKKDADWSACPAGTTFKKYEGADLLITAGLVLGKLRARSGVDPDFKMAVSDAEMLSQYHAETAREDFVEQARPYLDN